MDVEIPPQHIVKGSPHKDNGKMSFRFFADAVNLAREGYLHALVTAPISKRSWSLAGIHWPGHTEYLSQFYPKAIMCFWSNRLKVALFSHHISLRNALGRIERNSLFHFFLRLHDSLTNLSADPYHFSVAGLNPHAGENSLMGEEENNEISPAIDDAQRRGISISGPFPPDVVFRNALGQPQTIVISLYHDQGLIPFKLVSFDKGVNITLGLPFIRTSPDHGTAFDIAEKGKANPASMIEAIKLAYELLPPL